MVLAIYPMNATRNFTCIKCKKTIVPKEAAFQMTTKNTQSGVIICPSCLFTTPNVDLPVISTIESLISETISFLR